MTYRLIYLSDAHPAFRNDHIDDILSSSRRNNQADGLGGVLVYHEARFFQVLEGDEDAVLFRFNRISQDWRHNRIQLLQARLAGHRVFSDWSMGFLTPKDMGDVTRGALLDLDRVLPRDGVLQQGQANVAYCLIAFLESFETEMDRDIA